MKAIGCGLAKRLTVPVAPDYLGGRRRSPFFLTREEWMAMDVEWMAMDVELDWAEWLAWMEWCEWMERIHKQSNSNMNWTITTQARQ